MSPAPRLKYLGLGRSVLNLIVILLEQHRFAPYAPARPNFVGNTFLMYNDKNQTTLLSFIFRDIMELETDRMQNNPNQKFSV